MRMSVDVETFSSMDLKKSGVYKYVESPDFTILLIAYSIDGGQVKGIDCTSKEKEGMEEFIGYLYDPARLKSAFNANFERICLAKYLGRKMPPQEWQCTMVKCLTLGLPGSLEGAGIALGLPEDKLKNMQGKSLIRYFSKPCRPTRTNGQRRRNLPEHDPEKWELYKTYNLQDVVTEMAIEERLRAYEMTESERALWALDQAINDTGVAIDVDMVEKIVGYDEMRKEELQEEAKAITKLINPNSPTQLKEWLADQGMPVESLNKDTVSAMLENNNLPKDVRRVLEIRAALSKTSTAKYRAMLDAVGEDGRLKGLLQFYGANRSGRWAGRLVQVHNLARNSLPDLELARKLTVAEDFDSLQTLFGESSFIFSELVRTALVPSSGCRFVVSDFSAIEARVLSWLANEGWRLKAFREGKDIYCETASRMYKIPVEKHGQNAHLRQKGKVAELACGYQGGIGAMKMMDKSGSIAEEELQALVDSWRAANPKIVKLWRQCELAAKTAIRERRMVRMPRGLAFSYVDRNLFIKLPSGRKLCYWGTRLKEDPISGREQIAYMGVNQTTKRWSDTETYGGKLVENIVQAIARDCLAVTLKRVERLGYTIVMHVHDEIIADVPMEEKNALAAINACMEDPIEWALDLPLRGDGYETAFYKKD